MHSSLSRYLAANRCAELRSWLARQPDATMHLHPCYIIDERGKQLGIWRCPLPNGIRRSPKNMLLERLLVQNFIPIPAPSFRRDVFLRVGGLDERRSYAPNWDFYLKIIAVGPVCYHAQPLPAYRVQKNSLTIAGSKNIVDFRRRHQLVIDRHSPKLCPKIRAELLCHAMVSIEVNTVFAAAFHGDFFKIFKAGRAVLGLGPRRMCPIFLLVADRGPGGAAPASSRCRGLEAVPRGCRTAAEGLTT